MQLLTHPLQALEHGTRNQLQGQWRAQVRIRHEYNRSFIHRD